MIEVDLSEDREVVRLHQDHFIELVQLAAVFVDDVGLCEEIVQNTFVEFNQSGSERPSQAPAQDGPPPDLDWLYRVVLATARDEGRRSREATPMLTRLRSMPSEHAEALVLVHYLDLDIADVARIYDRRRRAVKRALVKAEATLKVEAD